MTIPVKMASQAQLLSWAEDPRAQGDFSPLAATPHLLFDAESDGLSRAQSLRVRTWLRELPCPSIGIGGENSPMADAGDVLVDEAADANLIIDNIRHSPIAASILVQLLRSTEALPVVDALTVESLAYATLQTGPEYQRWLKENRADQPAQHADFGPAVMLTRHDDRLNIDINRPSNRNAISVEVRDALVEAFQLVQNDDSIRMATVSGRGKCFSVGGDLSEFGTTPDPATGHMVRSLMLPARHLLRCEDRVQFHLHGACIGAGVELPSFARRVTASDDALFQLPEIKFGLIPGAGGCVSIPRRIGRQRTAWLALSAKRINAEHALAWGLVDEIMDDE